MSTRDLHVGGWAQGLYETSSTKKHPIGAKRVTDDGRIFRYAYNGAADLAVGKMTIAAKIPADVMNQTLPTAAIGTKTITYTINTATQAIPQDGYQNGQLQVNDSTGEGYVYPIAGHAAVTVADTSVILHLEEGIKVATVASTSEGTIAHNPWGGNGVVISSGTISTMGDPTGVPLVAVTANYYFWAQTGGLASCLCDADTGVEGQELFTSYLTNGAVGTGGGSAGATKTLGRVGRCYGTDGVSTEYKPIFLTIDM